MQMLYHRLLFPIRSKLAFGSHVPRFECSWILVMCFLFLENIFYVAYFPVCALVLKTKRINCYSCSHLYMSLEESAALISFLFNCLISSFRSTMTPSKISRFFDFFTSVPLVQVCAKAVSVLKQEKACSELNLKRASQLILK